MTVNRADRSTVCRCPACGQRLDGSLELPAPTCCPLCGFSFGDDRATGDDVTPYAHSYALGKYHYRGMCKWVWLAGWERLKHLAQMRASAASRRFARTNILLFALGMGIFQLTQTGWRHVTGLPRLDPTISTQPAGDGWVHVAAAPRPLPPNLLPETNVDLWWNPVQAGIAAASGIAVGLILMWLLLVIIRAWVTRAHLPPYRSEQRMTAAIHYSTAWGLPMFVAALLAGLGPLSLIGMMEQWHWYPPQRGFVILAAVFAGFGAIMWWFWLIRLGATAPAKTRRRVITVLAVAAPLMLLAAVAGWWWGLNLGHRHLFTLLRLDF